MRRSGIVQPRSAPPEGVIDALHQGRLRGWAWFPENPDATAIIEVLAGETLLHTFPADHYRQDLQLAGKRGGHCAFDQDLEGPAGTELIIAIVDPRTGQRTFFDGGPYLLTIQAGEPGLGAEEDTCLQIFPTAFAGDAGLTGFVDQFGPRRLRGWVYDASGHPVALNVREGEQPLFAFRADQWRADIAELREGQGACGFDLPIPEALCDGRMHDLQIYRDGSERKALNRPVRVRLGSANTGSRPLPWPEPLRRSGDGNGEDTLALSIIVNFYNMRREAERTLTSLTRDYQKLDADFHYEVICVDNGSASPLEACWIESFGTEFRLHKLDRQFPSPCHAINEAALSARGRYLGIMIDGAHLLSPGVIREAADAWRENAAAVVAVRHWFIGGDQRWLASVGYTREQEDRLFSRIHWPANGYELFRISAPIGENPEPWFDGLSESNCLLLPTALYDRIGGMDEAFVEAGGGFANLDLWRRAADAADAPLVSLIGEATFHQYHEGTTTNVDEAEKDCRVRAYASAYRARRGHDFDGIHRQRLTFRGSMRSEFATGIRQRPLLPMRLGVTKKIRPGQLAQHLDDGAQAYLQSVYAECALQHECRWQGLPVGVAPADLINIQQIVMQLRPDSVVLAGATPGLVRFTADILQISALGDSRLIEVSDKPSIGLRSRHLHIGADPHAPGNADLVAQALVATEMVLVLYAANGAGDEQVSSALAAYGRLVSYRSYLIYLDSLLGQPWLGYALRQSQRLIADFIAGHRDFVVDRNWNRQLITTSPRGYLHRVGGAITAARYDAALDALPALAESEDI